MRDASVQERQRTLSPEVQRKLKASRDEVASLSMREIHCQLCGYLVEKVFSDAVGHKMVYCRKCKKEYPINLGYFRTMRKKNRFHIDLSRQERQKR